MTYSPILIAGGGIGGFSAALALAQIGRPTIIFERSAVLSEVGAGLQLAPNATRRLKLLNAFDRCEAKAFKPKTIEIRRWRDGAAIASLPVALSESLWGAPYFIMHRADLLSALADTAHECGAIQLRLNAEVEGWRRNNREIVIRLKNGEEIAGQALIGADGVRSRTRAGLLLKDGGDSPLYTGRTAWRATIPREALPSEFFEPRGALWLGRRAHLTYYPFRGGQALNVVAIVQDEWRESDLEDYWSSVGDAIFLQSRFKNWPEEIRQIISSTQNWMQWPLFARAPLSRWAKDNIALLGDAAHAMPPFLAQGAAQAIEDATALGESFQEASKVQSHNDAREAFAIYQKKRVARANRIQAASHRQGVVYHLSGPASMARDAAMRLIGSSGMLRAMNWIYRA